MTWGDMDGDGDLDLAIGNFGGDNRVYGNVNGMLQTAPTWSSLDGDVTNSVAWGDVDGDGDLDLAAGNSDNVSKIYLNINGVLQTAADAPWFATDNDMTNSVAWGDLDGDGDLDLAAGNWNGLSKVYFNGRGSQDLPNTPPALAISRPITPSVTSFYVPPPQVQSSAIPLAYTLFDQEADAVGAVSAFYSLNGGGQWFPAIPATGTETSHLAASAQGVAHQFVWDTFTSGFFGQSQNVVVRMVAFPQSPGGVSAANGTYRYPNTVAGPIQHPYASATTYPFRVQGTQVRVYTNTVAAANGVADALVYRVPASASAGDAIARNGLPFTTDADGFLQGRGHLAVGDRLVALLPITATAKYTVYHTSAVPSLTGLTAFTMTTPGVQNLVVKADNPLILFNLSVSLEWDARKDTTYLAQLESDLHRASELLYDVTNGQAALGSITVYHDRTNWEGADIRIHATNRLRPHATIGGSVTEVVQKNLPNGSNPAIQLAFFPGAVEMPASWNRFGESSGSLGEDWPRALAHEFGHYLFFLLEDYLGLDTAGLPMAISTCPSLMGNVYLDENSEFHPAASWASPAYGCLSTLQHQTLKRSDWETLVAFYPWLKAPAQSYTNQLAGPSTLPLAVTKITYVTPTQPPTTLDVPSYYLIKPDGSRYLVSSSARAFRFHEGNLVDLGQPQQDRLQAWGARTGSDDRVCVFDMAVETPVLGCLTVSPGVTQLTVQATPTWHPDIVVAPVTTNTLALTVTNVAIGADLRVRVYATDRPLTTTPPAEIRLTYNATAKAYAGHLPIHLAANLHLWNATNPIQEMITDFTLGGAPDLGLGSGFTIRLAPGSTYKDDQGVTQTVGAEGAILTLRSDAALQLGSGNATILGAGSALQLGSGNVLPLGSGTALVLGSGTALVLGSGNALVLGSGNALILGSGNALVLGSGNALVLGSGNALVLGSGNAQVMEDGNGPVLSSDGQVVLYVDSLDFAPGQFYTLQPATRVPNPPDYATVVGQPYRLAASPGAPAIVGSSISFRYMGQDVPPGEESFLKVWFYNESTGDWMPLPTTLDAVQNAAAATAQGAGLYVLMSSIEIPLRSAGWNLISYPVQGSRTVTDALSYLAARQTDWWMLGYEDTDKADPWRFYAPQPSSLNQLSTLTTLDFGRGYWIHVSQPITLYMRGAGDVGQREATLGLLPPTTFWGPIFPSENFTPKADMLIQARIDGHLCGSTRTRLINGAVWYLLNISADDGAAFAGCGAADRTIQLMVEYHVVGPAQPWQDASLRALDLSLSNVHSLIFPLMFKAAPITPTGSQP